MLEYQLGQKYIDFVSHLPPKERGEVLWGSQSILSHCPGYLQKRIQAITPELSVFQVGKELSLLVYDDYAKRFIIDGGQLGSTYGTGDLGEAAVKESIVSLLKKDEAPFPDDDLERFLEANYFTNWFIKLLSKMPSEDRKLFEKKKPEAIKETVEPKKEEPKTPSTPLPPKTNTTKADIKVEPLPLTKKEEPSPLPKKEVAPTPVKKTPKKEDVDGEQYEKAILAELSLAYAKRQQAKKAIAPTPSTPLRHVKFAALENVISYTEENECLDLLLKRTRKNGCHLSDSDWLIILANTVDENFASVIESHYRSHVVYTDEPNKGVLRYAIIVKRAQKDTLPATDQLGVKLIRSKEASFQKDMPTGAFANIENEDDEEVSRPSFRTSEIRKVKVKTASFAPVIPEPVILENDGEDFTDFDDEQEPSLAEAKEGRINETSRDEEPIVPKNWHCYLCGKKKIYSGEPAETITLRNGETAFLCKKHRGKM